MQVILESLDAAADAIGLAAEVAVDLPVQLFSALLELLDLLLQALALLLKFLQGQLLPVRFRC